MKDKTNKFNIMIPNWNKDHKTELSTCLTCGDKNLTLNSKCKCQENIYLNRLKEQYVAYVIEFKTHYFKNKSDRLERDYLAMRLFCLDTQLISFNDIEVMEFEVNESFV